MIVGKASDTHFSKKSRNKEELVAAIDAVVLNTQKDGFNWKQKRVSVQEAKSYFEGEPQTLFLPIRALNDTTVCSIDAAHLNDLTSRLKTFPDDVALDFTDIISGRPEEIYKIGADGIYSPPCALDSVTAGEMELIDSTIKMNKSDSQKENERRETRNKTPLFNEFADIALENIEKIRYQSSLDDSFEYIQAPDFRPGILKQEDILDEDYLDDRKLLMKKQMLLGKIDVFLLDIAAPLITHHLDPEIEKLPFVHYIRTKAQNATGLPTQLHPESPSLSKEDAFDILSELCRQMDFFEDIHEVEDFNIDDLTPETIGPNFLPIHPEWEDHPVINQKAFAYRAAQIKYSNPLTIPCEEDQF